MSPPPLVSSRSQAHSIRLHQDGAEHEGTPVGEACADHLLAYVRGVCEFVDIDVCNFSSDSGRTARWPLQWEQAFGDPSASAPPFTTRG